MRFYYPFLISNWPDEKLHLNFRAYLSIKLLPFLLLKKINAFSGEIGIIFLLICYWNHDTRITEDGPNSDQPGS